MTNIYKVTTVTMSVTYPYFDRCQTLLICVQVKVFATKKKRQK